MNGQNKTAIFSKQYNTVTFGTKQLSLQTLQSNQQGQYCYTATFLLITFESQVGKGGGVRVALQES